MVLIGGVLLVVLLGVAIWFGRGTYQTARLGTVYVAKQTCSCLFIAHRTPESCRTDYDPAAISTAHRRARLQQRYGFGARWARLCRSAFRGRLRLSSGELIVATPHRGNIMRKTSFVIAALLCIGTSAARGTRAAAAAARRRSVADERMADGPAAGRRRSRRAAMQRWPMRSTRRRPDSARRAKSRSSSAASWCTSNTRPATTPT